MSTTTIPPSDISSAKPADTNPVEEKKPMVLISGAGVGGLMLALILERIKIPYILFERAEAVKPIGSALTVNAAILAVFEQLGLLQELLKISKAIKRLDMFNGDMTPLTSMNHERQIAISGYDIIIFARPDFYKLLLDQIPAEKFLMKKKVISMEQDLNGVTIHCQDESTYHGDILVGADGAYSTVRQNMYRTLKELNQLPESDKENLALGFIMMVGVTNSMDPAKYPALEDEQAHFRQVIGDENKSWSISTAPGNRFCWGVVIQIETKEEAKRLKLLHSEWSSGPSPEMFKQFKDLQNGYDGPLSDLFDATSQEYISTIFLEEKLFETWHHGRTVLMGDACHKMLPAGGQGAVNAMQDAVILANCLYDLNKVTSETITAAFESYREQRYPDAKFHVNNSRFLAKLMSGQKFGERIMRKILFNYLPDWMQLKEFEKQAAYRPQLTCMPMVESRGYVPPRPQKPSVRYTREQLVAKAKVQDGGVCMKEE